MRRAWEEKRKILCGPFFPQSRKAGNNVGNIWKDLPSMIKELANTIENDWDDVDFSMYVFFAFLSQQLTCSLLVTMCVLRRYADDEQLIIVFFENIAFDDEEAAAYDRKALLVYMNNLASFEGLDYLLFLFFCFVAGTFPSKNIQTYMRI